MSVEAEARRLSTAVDRLERESLEVLAALGLHKDTPHAEVLAYIRDLRGKVNKPRAYLDDLLARVERGARAAERKMVIAWLAEPCGTWDHAPRCATCSYKARLAFDIRDGLHLPAPSPNTDGGGGA